MTALAEKPVQEALASIADDRAAMVDVLLRCRVLSEPAPGPFGSRYLPGTGWSGVSCV